MAVIEAWGKKLAKLDEDGLPDISPLLLVATLIQEEMKGARVGEEG